MNGETHSASGVSQSAKVQIKSTVSDVYVS